MTDRAEQGAWVEVQRIVLSPEQRAPQIPEDTRRLPLEMRVKGFLIKSAVLGEEVEIRTPSGRHLRGTLVEVNPAYSHGFGPPIPELSTIGEEARKLLREKGSGE